MVALSSEELPEDPIFALNFWRNDPPVHGFINSHTYIYKTGNDNEAHVLHINVFSLSLAKRYVMLFSVFLFIKGYHKSM